VHNRVSPLNQIDPTETELYSDLVPEYLEERQPGHRDAVEVARESGHLTRLEANEGLGQSLAPAGS